MKVKGSYLWAGAIVIGVAGWLGSDNLIMHARGLSQENANTGNIAEGSANSQKTLADSINTPAAAALTQVRVAVLQPEERTSELVVRGRTEAARKVEVRGETAGIVAATPVQKGTEVKKGEVLCLLDLAERQSNLDQARAALEWASLDYTVAQNLGKKGYGAKNKEMSQKANFDAARAALARAELDIQRTQITAPFDGVVETRAAEVGSYISVGGPCATVVELSPLLVVGYVGEREVGALSKGMKAVAQLATGDRVEGEISFISSSAELTTRTFRVEIEVKNEDLSAKDGVTAEIHVPLQPVKAHRFSPAVLTLRDDGAIGVRLVNSDDVVEFVPVTILASGTEGVWVSGLAPSPVVITVGHEYVKAGQKVKPIMATPAKTAEVSK